MRTKFVVLIAVVLFSLGANVYAQPGGNNNGRGPGGHGPMDSTRVIKENEDLAKALSLSSEQKTKILALQMAQFKEMKSKMKPSEGNAPGKPDEATMKAMKESREKLDADIKNILTDEQKTKFAEYQKNHQLTPPNKGGKPKN